MKRKSTKKQINQKLYIGQATLLKPAPRKEVVEIVLDVLNKPQFRKLQKHIEKISILRMRTSSYTVTVGEIKDGNKGKRLFIYDHNGVHPSHYSSTTVHELSHTHWGIKQKWDNEAWTKFNNSVKNLRPVTDYLRRRENKFKSDKRWNFTQYENEMHSAAAEIYYYPDTHLELKFFSDVQKLVDAYAELHGLPKKKTIHLKEEDV